MVFRPDPSSASFPPAWLHSWPESPTTITSVNGRRHRILDTPTGPFHVSVDAEGEVRTGWVSRLEITPRGPGSTEELGRSDPNLLPDLCERILNAVHGTPVDFDDVAIAPGTPFQRLIWRATRTIKAGSVLTYGQLAIKVGRRRAARAVGQAMRRNPQPIITPCHRVVSSAGLGGFAGESENAITSGIKIHLLRVEGIPLTEPGNVLSS